MKILRKSSVVGLQCSGSTGWGFVGEISSQRLRPYTAGFAAAISCVGGVIMNVLVPYMLNENQWVSHHSCDEVDDRD